MSAAEVRAAAFARLHPPTMLAAHAKSCFASGRTPRGPKLVEARWMRYAASADLRLRITLQRDGRIFGRGSAICHGKAPKLQELMRVDDFGRTPPRSPP